jgi:hypothetical protein
MITANGLGRTVVIFDGQLEVTMMPFNTMKAQIIHEQLRKEQPPTEWSSVKNAFLFFAGMMVNIKPLVEEDALSLESQGVLYFAHNQTGDVLKNFDLFQSVIPATALSELYKAYNETRVSLPQAPEILHDGRPDDDADPEDSSVGKKPSKAKS